MSQQQPQRLRRTQSQQVRCPVCGRPLELPAMTCRVCDADLYTGFSRRLYKWAKNKQTLIDLGKLAGLLVVGYIVYKNFLRDYISSLF